MKTLTDKETEDMLDAPKREEHFCVARYPYIVLNAADYDIVGGIVKALEGTISLRTDNATDTAPARLIRGINHRASDGNVTARLGARSRPAARLANRQSSGEPDGHSPIQAIATRTPRVAIAPGSLASSRSERAHRPCRSLLGGCVP